MAENKYIGKWKAVSVKVMDITEPLKNSTSILSINADGTAVYGEGEDRKDYTWKETGYGLYLDGRSDMKLTDEEGRLSTRLLGFITVIFEKLD